MPSTADDAAASADRLDTDEVVDEWDDDDEYADDEYADGEENADEEQAEGEYADEEQAEAEYAEDQDLEYDDEGVEAEDEDDEYEEYDEDDADWDGGEEDAPAPRRGIAAFAAGGLSRFRRRRGTTEDAATTESYAEESLAPADAAYIDEEFPGEDEDASDEDWDDEEDLGEGPYAPSPHLDGPETRGSGVAGGSTAVASRGGARRAPRSPALGTVVRRPRLPRTRRVTSPQLHPVAGAAATGLLTGLVGVVLTLLTMSGCAALLGTPSCGGGLGFVGLVVVITVTVLAGRAMMRFLSVPDAAAIAFVGVVTVVVLLLLLAPDSLFSVWMWVVAPLLAAATFAATCALTMSAETSPEGR